MKKISEADFIKRAKIATPTGVRINEIDQVVLIMIRLGEIELYETRGGRVVVTSGGWRIGNRVRLWGLGALIDFAAFVKRRLA